MQSENDEAQVTSTSDLSCIRSDELSAMVIIKNWNSSTAPNSARQDLLVHSAVTLLQIVTQLRNILVPKERIEGGATTEYCFRWSASKVKNPVDQGRRKASHSLPLQLASVRYNLGLIGVILGRFSSRSGNDGRSWCGQYRFSSESCNGFSLLSPGLLDIALQEQDQFAVDGRVSTRIEDLREITVGQTIRSYWHWGLWIEIHLSEMDEMRGAMTFSNSLVKRPCTEVIVGWQSRQSRKIVVSNQGWPLCRIWSETAFAKHLDGDDAVKDYVCKLLIEDVAFSNLYIPQSTGLERLGSLVGDV